ncbi:hypothetical protein Tco_0422187 [Tanacetum coccineum]
MSSSSSKYSNRYANVPTDCKCLLPLMTLTSWTRSDPARRFRICRNKYLDNEWNRAHLCEMHLLLNPSQREELDNEVRRQEELLVFHVAFADMVGQILQLKEELIKS